MIAGAVTGKSKLEEYLALEEASEERYEFLGGRIYAMGGSSVSHVAISSALLVEIGNSLSGSGCRAYGSDLRVKFAETDQYVYPDLTVVCGKMIVDDKDARSVLNPILIVEVLSPSTALYDFSVKVPVYQSIPTVEAILLVRQDEPRVHLYHRTDSGFVHQSVQGLDASLAIPKPQLTLNLSEIYHGIDFEAPRAESTPQ